MLLCLYRRFELKFRFTGQILRLVVSELVLPFHGVKSGIGILSAKKQCFQRRAKPPF